jgi:DNA polymerase elongation subunit (family B)
MQLLADCPPRLLVPAPAALPAVLSLQIITVDAMDNPIAWHLPPPTNRSGTPVFTKCNNVADGGFYMRTHELVTRRTKEREFSVILLEQGQEAPAEPPVRMGNDFEVHESARRHAVHIYGRTPEGYSVLLQVLTHVGLVLEFPEMCTADHMTALINKIKLHLETPQVKFTIDWRARSNGWVPDPTDPTRPKLYPVVLLRLQNMYEYNLWLKAVTAVNPVEDLCTYVNGERIVVSPFETLDYIKSVQRFLLENKLSPGSWIKVANPRPLGWPLSTCDWDVFCEPGDITSNDADQSVCPLTIMSWDIECINGTAEERRQMQALGLDKFPRASDPNNPIVQISVAFQMADKRQLRFLLELADETATETRVFETLDYRVFYFAAEPDMLLFFRDLMVYYDPDICLSFNGDRFDWPYVMARMGRCPPYRDCKCTPRFSCFQQGQSMCPMSKARDGTNFARFNYMGRNVMQRWDSKYMRCMHVYSLDQGRTWTPVYNSRALHKVIPVINQDDEDDDDEDDDKHVPDTYEFTKDGSSFALHELALERGVSLTPELVGRVSLDLCAFIRTMSTADKYLAFKNYTLDNMAERFLGDHKVDLNHGDIFDAWNGAMQTKRFLDIVSSQQAAAVNAWLPNGLTIDSLQAHNYPVPLKAQRRLLGDYCMKDTLLPLRILDKLGTVMFLWQVARVAMVPPHNIINNGQMMRVSTMFIGEAWAQQRYVIRLANRPMAYQGATVLSPKRGYYGGVDDSCPPLEPQPPLPPGYDFEGIPAPDLIQRQVKYAILTLDFKSLYPSIMLSHVLCPSNLFLSDEPLTAAEECAARYAAKSNSQMLLVRNVYPLMEAGPSDTTLSGVVWDAPDAVDYTTVCVVVTDKKTAAESRRYHKFNKHTRGIYPTLLQNLLDGRDIYKKKMNLEKAVVGTLELQFGHAPPGRDDTTSGNMSLIAIHEALESLRATIKPVMKDKEKRLAALAAWLEAHPWALANMHTVYEVLELYINIYDGRQKALKVMANSIYGVSGAKQHSPCACCQLAESVTAIGRQMHKASTECALEHFAHYGTDVIYGDTDSIFVCIAQPDDKEAWRIASEIATYITEVIFAGTINVLEDECIKRMLALFKKKNYVGMENEDVKTGIYHLCEKGVATVRRDKPEVLNILVRQLNKAFTELGHLPIHTIARVLLRLCMAHLERLVRNEFYIDDYSIAQRINVMTSESAHMTVAAKMRQRAGIPVNRGDTVNYVHIIEPGKDKARDRADATVYVRSHPEIPIDRGYYLSNKIQGIVASLLDLFLPPELISELFSTYQFVLDFPGRHVLLDAELDPASERRRRLEDALDRAIAAGRMPQGPRPVPALINRKRPEPLQVTHTLQSLLTLPTTTSTPAAAAPAPSAPAAKKKKSTKPIIDLFSF